jgi:hypothetical protein
MKNLQLPFYYIFFTFSFLSFFFQFFNKNKDIANALYFANFISLLGFCIIIYAFPTSFYDRFNYLHTNIYIFNFICIVLHIAPLYLFRNRNTIDKLNLVNTIIYVCVFLLLYFICFYPVIEVVYPFCIEQLFIMSLFLISICSICSVIFIQIHPFSKEI